MTFKINPAYETKHENGNDFRFQIDDDVKNRIEREIEKISNDANYQLDKTDEFTAYRQIMYILVENYLRIHVFLTRLAAKTGDLYDSDYQLQAELHFPRNAEALTKQPTLVVQWLLVGLDESFGVGQTEIHDLPIGFDYDTDNEIHYDVESFKRFANQDNWSIINDDEADVHENSPFDSFKLIDEYVDESTDEDRDDGYTRGYDLLIFKRRD